jgi:hypothetical protein
MNNKTSKPKEAVKTKVISKLHTNKVNRDKISDKMAARELDMLVSDKWMDEDEN